MNKHIIAIAQFREGIYAGLGKATRILIEQLQRTEKIKIISFSVGRRAEGHSLLNRSIYQIADVIRCFYMLCKYRPALVHLNSVLAEGALFRDVMMVMIARLLRIRVFVAYNGSKRDILSTGPFWKIVIARILIQFSNKVGVTSRQELQEYKNIHYDDNKFVLVKNPIQPMHGIINNYVENCERGKTTLLFTARFDESKGVLDVIYALSYLQKNNVDCRLILAGDGEMYTKAKELVNELNLRNSVTISGWVNEEILCKYYRQSNIFVFPTYYYQEGFPMVILEALAAGLPIVTTRYRAMADYLQDGHNCLFVEPGNPSDIAEKIYYLVKSPVLMQQMSDNNLELVKGFYPEVVASEFNKIYQDILVDT